MLECSHPVLFEALDKSFVAPVFIEELVLVVSQSNL